MNGGMKQNPLDFSKKKTRLAYAPSLAGVFSGKVEKKTKKMYSGFEIRGIRKGKRRRGLF